jgi:hypothetical protein
MKASIGEDEYANSLCERLHVGANETGILYYDRGVKGDWFLIARLPYSTLALEIRHPESELLPFIQEEAKKMQAKRGDPWKCSATGKAVILGQPHP